MSSGLGSPVLPPMALRCPKCTMPFECEATGGTSRVQCPACTSALTVALFPAFTSPPEAVSTASGAQAAEGEAVCFFHPGKRAEQTCAHCGRFLCTLCDMPVGGRHLCPKCLDAAKVAELVPVRFVGGYVAMLCGILPLILFPCGCIYAIPFTGPAAVFLGFWSWNKPGSLVHGARHGMAVAGMIGGLLQIAAVAAGVVGIVYAINNA